MLTFLFFMFIFSINSLKMNVFLILSNKTVSIYSAFVTGMFYVLTTHNQNRICENINNIDCPFDEYVFGEISINNPLGTLTRCILNGYKYAICTSFLYEFTPPEFSPMIPLFFAMSVTNTIYKKTKRQ